MIPVDPYQQQQPMSLPPTTNLSSQIDQEFSQINQQFQDLSLQYQNPTYEYGNVGVESPSTQPAEINTMNSYGDQTNQYQQQQPISYEPLQQTDFYGQQPQQPNEFTGNTNTGYTEHQTPQQYQYGEQQAYGASNFGSNEVNFRLLILSLNIWVLFRKYSVSIVLNRVFICAPYEFY